MTAWTPRTREVAIEASSFALESVYDGGEDGRPHVEPGSVGGLLWHVLAKKGG